MQGQPELETRTRVGDPEARLTGGGYPVIEPALPLGMFGIKNDPRFIKATQLIEGEFARPLQAGQPLDFLPRPFHQVRGYPFAARLDLDELWMDVPQPGERLEVARLGVLALGHDQNRLGRPPAGVLARN